MIGGSAFSKNADKPEPNQVVLKSNKIKWITTPKKKCKILPHLEEKYQIRPHSLLVLLFTHFPIIFYAQQVPESKYFEKPLNFNVRLKVMRPILATNGDIYVGMLPRMKGLKGSINVATSINLAPLGWRTYHGKFVAGENNILSFSSPYSYKLFGLFWFWGGQIEQLLGQTNHTYRGVEQLKTQTSAFTLWVSHIRSHNIFHQHTNNFKLRFSKL